MNQGTRVYLNSPYGSMKEIAISAEVNNGAKGTIMRTSAKDEKQTVRWDGAVNVLRETPSMWLREVKQ